MKKRMRSSPTLTTLSPKVILTWSSQARGLQFPGYEPRPQAEYSGPSFPPQKAAAGGGDWMAGGSQAPPRQSQLSDVMAEDLRRRDLLERNAVYW